MAYRLYVALSDMDSAAAAAVCSLWRYTSVICLAFAFRHNLEAFLFACY